MTEWRDVPGWPGYSVSDDGRVIGSRGRELAQRVTPLGEYREVLMYQPGQGKAGRKIFRVHRIVLMAFVGPPTVDAPFGAHLDGNPANNRLSNLVWASAKENTSHKELHGTFPRGEQNGRAILTADDVRAIRARVEAGDRNCHLADEYGVSRVLISRIKLRKAWRHI